MVALIDKPIIESIDIAQPDSLNYVCFLFNFLIDQQKNADKKAQVLLTLNGAFLAFLIGLIAMNQDDLSDLISNFDYYIWLSLVLMALSLSLSIIFTLICLWARIGMQKNYQKFIDNYSIDINDSKTYTPEIMLFFQSIIYLDPIQFQERISSIDKRYEILAIGSQIIPLSKICYDKYRSINMAFVFTGLSLIFLLNIGIRYIASVA